MRKKILVAISLTMAVIVIFASNVMATKIGDVAGNYYTTDIKTYINGEQVTSYNIGGKMVVLMEDLKKAGLKTSWDEKNKISAAVVDFEKYSSFNEAVITPSIKPPNIGSVAGQYYTTDIKAYINGEQVTGYNIGGKMVVLMEDLKKAGFKTSWDEKNRVSAAIVDFNKYSFLNEATRFPTPIDGGTWITSDVSRTCGFDKETARIMAQNKGDGNEIDDFLIFNFLSPYGDIDSKYMTPQYFVVAENETDIASYKFDYSYIIREDSGGYSKLIITPKKEYLPYDGMVTVYMSKDIKSGSGQYGDKWYYFSNYIRCAEK